MTKLADKAFSAFGWSNGFIANLDREWPSYLSAWTDGNIQLHAGDTHFGYVHEGVAQLRDSTGQAQTVLNGQAFCIAGPAVVGVPAYGLKGRGIVVSRQSWQGLRYIAGPLEHEGRLKYIDGCTDSLLIPPVKLGDPCLNLLYFPPGIDQTQHIHPSDRIGLILSGHGLCHATEFGVEQTVELVPGMIFCIHTNGEHKFSTPFGTEMRVLAYHPESDYGPTDENHPMLNKTMVEQDGQRVSAATVDAIRTK